MGNQGQILWGDPDSRLGIQGFQSMGAEYSTAQDSEMGCQAGDPLLASRLLRQEGSHCEEDGGLQRKAEAWLSELE